jgi:F-type H+-transporting ATPase subunit alpha
MRNVPVNKVKAFEFEFIQQLDQRYPEVLQGLKAGKLDDTITTALETVAKELGDKY